MLDLWSLLNLPPQFQRTTEAGQVVIVVTSCSNCMKSMGCYQVKLGRLRIRWREDLKITKNTNTMVSEEKCFRNGIQPKRELMFLLSEEMETFSNLCPLSPNNPITTFSCQTCK